MTTTEDKRIAWEAYKQEEEEDNELEDKGFDDNEVGSPLIPFKMADPDASHTPKEVLHPFKYFKCFKCYTNFNVTKRQLLTIEKVKGVEILMPLTRYSFIIAVGKLFCDDTVKESVKEAIFTNDKV